MNVDELRAKYPTYTIMQDPDPNCRTCKGAGQIKTRSGVEAPCMCACFSMPHGDDKRDLMRAIGNAARDLSKEYSK